MIRGTGRPLRNCFALGEEPLIVLPPMAGGQLESWRALVELAPTLGERCLLVGGQMVLLREVERGAVETRPTDDVDVVVDLRVVPTGLVTVHAALLDVGVRPLMCWHPTTWVAGLDWRWEGVAPSRCPVRRRLSNEASSSGWLSLTARQRGFVARRCSGRSLGKCWPCTRSRR